MTCTALNLTIPFSSKNHSRSFPLTGTRFRTRNPNRTLHRFHYHGFLREAESSFARNYELSSIKRRRRLTPLATSLELPLLPFNLNEVLVPSESKTLHLYEARYLALLEESLTKKKKLFVHFVLEPIIMNDSSAEPSFAARYGCLVYIENVERLDVGALVSIRGLGRIKIVEFLQADPFLKGVVVPEKDKAPENLSSLSSKLTEAKEALKSLNSLEIKLKSPKEARLQTQTANSLVWAEKKEPFLDCDEAFIPSLSERVSFAGYQPVSGSTESELLKLQRKKIRAMDVKDTLERFDELVELIKENISIVAAKLAIQSIETQ